MKTTTTLLIFLSLISLSISGQELGKISIKQEGYTEKKFNHPPKKIYLEQFTVNYQKVMVTWASAKKGFSHGSASAGLALGLEGISDSQLQTMTDRLYQQFMTKMQEAGFEFYTPEEIAANDHFKKRDPIEGGKPIMDMAANGYLSTIPTGFTFFAGGNSAFNLAGNPESNALGGAIVARVNITVPFAESQSIEGGLVGGVAKITAKCDLRLSPLETIPKSGDFSKPDYLATEITFAFKESLKWQALHKGKLKEPLEIEGVLDEKTKYKSTSVSVSGNSLSAIYSKAYAENAVLIPVDAKVYEDGVQKAMSVYLEQTIESFLGHFE